MTYFTFNGFEYRTNSDATVIEGRDGDKWNITHSVRVFIAACAAVGI